MDKKLRRVLLCAIIFFVLVILWVFLSRANEDDKDTSQEETLPVISEELIMIDRDPEEVEKIILENPNGTFTILPKDDGGIKNYYLAGEEDLLLDTALVNGLVHNAATLKALERLSQTQDPSQYGLDTGAKALITFSDGTEETIIMGSQSPDKRYYYCALESSDAVYMVATYTGNRYYYGYNDFLDKRLQVMDYEQTQYLKIETNDQVIELVMGYPKGIENIAVTEETLIMKAPYEGYKLYTENLYAELYSILDSIDIIDVIAIHSGDGDELLSYGLDAPSLKATATTASGQFSFSIGDQRGEDELYFMYEGSDHVYTVSSEPLLELFDIVPLNLIEPLALGYDLRYVTDIHIQDDQRDLTIALNHYDDLELDPNGTKDLLDPEINSISVYQGDLRTAYLNLIGISYESSIEGFIPGQKPNAFIELHLLIPEEAIQKNHPDFAQLNFDAETGKYSHRERINLYEVENDFYVIEKNGQTSGLITSKRRVNVAFDGFEALIDQQNP